MRLNIICNIFFIDVEKEFVHNQTLFQNTLLNYEIKRELLKRWKYNV